MKRYYLAYGSNLNLRQMKYRCPDAKIVGVTKINNYRLMFKGSKTGSYLTIEKAKGYYVPVAVWETSQNDELNLDRYEGYPTFYYKKEFPLSMKIHGKMVYADAYAYIMHENRKHGVPSEYYVETCMEGYESFGFDPDILEEAIIYSAEQANAESQDKAVTMCS